MNSKLGLSLGPFIRYLPLIRINYVMLGVLGERHGLGAHVSGDAPHAQHSHGFILVFDGGNRDRGTLHTLTTTKTVQL